MSNINGVILSVQPFMECVQFYRDKMSFKVLMEKSGIIRFQFGPMYIQIEDSKKLRIAPTENIILRENVSDILEVQKDLLKNGIKLEIHNLEWGEIGFVYDPHGTKIEYFREK